MEYFFDDELFDVDLTTPTLDREACPTALESAGEVLGFHSNDNNNGELEHLMQDGSQMNLELVVANSMSSFPSLDTVHKHMVNYADIPLYPFSNIHQSHNEFIDPSILEHPGLLDTSAQCDNIAPLNPPTQRFGDQPGIPPPHSNAGCTTPATYDLESTLLRPQSAFTQGFGPSAGRATPLLPIDPLFYEENILFNLVLHLSGSTSSLLRDLRENETTLTQISPSSPTPEVAVSISQSVEEMQALRGSAAAKKTKRTRQNARSPVERPEDSGMLVFSADLNIELAQRKRKRFCADRRKEVHLVRMVGACMQCKFRKVPCNFGGPCKRCIDLAGGVGLGKSLCTRQSFVTTRFGSIDLYEESSFDYKLANEMPMFQGGRAHTVHVYLPGTPALQIFVENDNEFQGIQFQHIHIITESYGGKGLSLGGCYAIPANKLPTVQDLLNWIPAATHKEPSKNSFKHLANEFAVFAGAYVRAGRDLPLHESMERALQIHKLQKIWGHGIRCYDLEENLEWDQDFCYASPTVHRQLHLIAARGIAQAEAELLSDLQRLIQGSLELSQATPLAIWVCLWLLILTYRMTLDCINNIVQSSASYARELAKSQELAQHMYDLVVSAYSAYFRTSSPLNSYANPNERQKVLGQNEDLIAAFETLSLENRHFHIGTTENRSSKDHLLFSMIVDRETKELDFEADREIKSWRRKENEYRDDKFCYVV